MSRMPMIAPVGPAYFSQPKAAPISTQTRAVTLGGSTESR